MSSANGPKDPNERINEASAVGLMLGFVMGVILTLIYFAGTHPEVIFQNAK